MSALASPAPWFRRLFAQRSYLDLAIVLVLILLVRGLPRWILLNRSYVTIHDNLDSDLLYRVLINRPGRLFDYAGTIPEMLGGVPRWTFPSGLKFSSLVFHWLGPFDSYCLLEQTVSLAGATGMWLVLRDYVPSHRFYHAGIALCFGLLPFMPIYDCSVAGQPLILWALLNAWFGRKRLVSLALCTAFAFFSVLQMSGLFVVAEALLGVAAAAFWHRRSRSWQSLLWPSSCAIAIGCGYLITDYGFLSHYLLDDFVSHREAYSVLRSAGGIDLNKVASLFLLGRYHAASHHEAIAVLAGATAALAFWRGRRRQAVVIFSLGLLALIIAFSYDFPRWPGISWLAQVVPALGQITPRFWWSFPLLWHLIWGIAVAAWPPGRRSQLAFAVFLALQLPLSAFRTRDEEHKNYRLLWAHVLGLRPSRAIPTYRSFVARTTVEEIKNYVGKSPGRFLCLGFHPSVLQLHDLQTVDGYRDLYPLAYKVAFRKLMEEDLERDAKQAQYFDEFGGRVYYFYPNAQAEHFSFSPFTHHRPRIVRMNHDAAQALGVRWVVSTFPILGPTRSFLQYEDRFARKNGFVFYLYSLE